MATKRFFYEKMKELVNTVSGPMTKSTFQTTGKLTPQEFIDAGDALVQKFPAWEWMGGPEDIQEYLPKDKKYLMLRKCPCRERASTMMQSDAQEADAGDDWTDTHKEWKPKQKAQAQAMEMEEEKPQGGEAEFQWSDDDDDGAAAPKEAPKPAAAAANNNSGEDPFRIYDVTVVYDQYYATPRVYLFGYDENSVPLTKELMMEDVYAENREKTVTVDPHPFLKQPCISIHPCRHAETMQRLIARLEQRFNDEQEDEEEANKIPFIFPTYMALFPFLKFIASVVPTIQYDISIDLDM